MARRLKADPLLRLIPIIAVTSHASPGSETLSRSAGCEGYIAKPFSPRQLRSMIRTLLPGACVAAPA